MKPSLSRNLSLLEVFCPSKTSAVKCVFRSRVGRDLSSQDATLCGCALQVPITLLLGIPPAFKFETGFGKEFPCNTSTCLPFSLPYSTNLCVRFSYMVLPHWTAARQNPFQPISCSSIRSDKSPNLRPVPYSFSFSMWHSICHARWNLPV